MDRFKARPLQPLSLTSRPLASHALSWSCDAELAVATQDCIYIYLPEYVADKDANADERDSSQYQFPISLQPSAIINPNPSINENLCALKGVKVPALGAGEDTSLRTVGKGTVSETSSALGQVNRVEWSPNGLGCNLRPVLMAMTTNGSLVTFGEHIDRQSTITSSMRTRSFKNWKMLWGLGAKLPVPDARHEGGFRNMNEHIVSFSWAKEIAPGRALLAYLNDSGQIVVMSIQYYPREQTAKRGSEQESVWDLMEVARFDAKGPHENQDSQDPDFSPHGSIFSLRWSPWLVCETYRTATLAYLAPNYIGFRRIIIHGGWEKGSVPVIQVEDRDTTSTCLFLSSDAFIEWEDMVWTQGDAHISRGVVATPFVVEPFEVALNGALNESSPPHSPWECSTVYPNPEETSTNPITGLIIHHPDPYNKPEMPLYSGVRLSATATNSDWYETSLPEETVPLPQWVEGIAAQNRRLVSRAAALGGGADSDSDFESDSEDDADRMEEDTETAPTKLQVHPFRFRLWGLAQSPGDGCTAVLISKHSTQHPDRRGLSSIHFDWQIPADDQAPQMRIISKPLTTEGRMWEWMYGLGEQVVGVTTPRTAAAITQQTNPLRELFKTITPTLPCVFCNARLNTEGDEAICENGHPFATCAASGIPIMAPGISRICSVCKMRCLKVSELEKLAQEHLGSAEAVGEASGDVCGGCGGKFIV